MVHLEDQISNIWSQQLLISCALVLFSALLQGHRFVYEVLRPVQLLGVFWDFFGILRGSLRTLLEAFGNTFHVFGEALGIHGVAFGGHSQCRSHLAAPLLGTRLCSLRCVSFFFCCGSFLFLSMYVYEMFPKTYPPINKLNFRPVRHTSPEPLLNTMLNSEGLLLFFRCVSPQTFLSTLF